MVSGVLREIVQQLVIGISFVFVAMVLLTGLYEVRASLIQSRLRNKRARRRHITIIIDGMDADEEAVEATMASIAKNRYAAYDVVIISDRRKGVRKYPRVTRFYASEQTSEALRIHDAFLRSKQGDYVVTVTAGVELRIDALQEINRAFYFRKRIRKLMLRFDSRAYVSLMDSWSYLVSSMSGLWIRALSSLAVYRSSSLQIVALRSEDLNTGHRLASADILPCVDMHNTRPNSGWVAALYVFFAIFVIYDFFVTSNKTQLIVAAAFVGAIVIIASLIDSWSSREARKLLLWYAPSAFFVLLITTITKIIDDVGLKVPERTNSSQ